jgi:ABC-type bacteriocin/lantibiotic exporter with double-glycine peptidase domain
MKKITPIKQRDEIACGPTCIEMAMSYLDCNPGFEKIAKTSRYKKRDGLTNQDLVNTLKELGLTTKESNNNTWEQLTESNNDKSVIILSWMKGGYLGHFSVLEFVGKNHIKIIDPDVGKSVKIEKIEFMRLWMDYDDMWYPEKNTDIQLRWMCAISKKT